MAAKKVGVLVKEARTAAGLTQEKLAQKAGEGLTGNDIGKCERGVSDLTQAQLKKIAVVCGVTQSSLINAPKNDAAGKKETAAKSAAAKKAETTAKKTGTAAKTATAKKTETAAKKTGTAAKTAAAKKNGTAAKTAAAKKTGTAAKTPAVPAGANTTMKVTATEKKLVEAYRSASGDMKKVALKVLKGEYGDKMTNLLNLMGGGSSSGSSSGGLDLSDTISNLIGGLFGGK